ncbi:outer membrane lipid asymmetry maintenance protein MlaD [bacterium]|nr:outer membrane lipid asymmetry maintenance protein MlaD [bacterium]
MTEKNAAIEKEKAPKVAVPKRTFTVELLVGVFTLLGVLAAGYQAVGLAGMSIGPSNEYLVKAEFDNISGLKTGASVEIAGVPIGKVVEISLKDPQAITVLQIDNDIKLYDDDIAAVRTKGIIGDRYVKISRGASDTVVEPGGILFETESVVDIEDIIGKLVHSFGDDDEEQTIEGLD